MLEPASFCELMLATYVVHEPYMTGEPRISLSLGRFRSCANRYPDYYAK